ncbi:MAG: ROK family protein [Chthoniobacterales bacterium]|nr:ROK family protein [Chthoniobacterales bacterium]
MKPQILFQHSPENNFLWGVDLGGTKIEAAIIDPTRLDLALYRRRIPTEQDLGYDHILLQIKKLIEEIETISGLHRPSVIGFGTPGVTDPATGKLKNSNTQCLNDHALREDLSSTLDVQAILANDANCFTLAEATLGVARGKKVVMGLILGTGVGGGVVVNGQLLEGLHGIAGEWGHNTLRGEEAPCYCGKKGCNEQVFSGPALEHFYQKQTGQLLSLSEIVHRATTGESAAQATLKRLQEKFAEAIAVPINILDPDAIVIGGGLDNIELLYIEETRQKILPYIFNNELKTPFLKPILGDSAGVFGAALLTMK